MKSSKEWFIFMLRYVLIVCLVLLGIILAEAEVIVRVNDITTKGKTFRVVCTVQGETFVGWFKKDGTKVTSQDEFEKFHYVVSGPNEYTLVVKKVVVSDGGTYQCRGSVTAKNFTLYVEFYVTYAPTNQEFNASRTANIVCTAAGFPQPVFRWFKNRKELDPEKDNRYTIMRNGTLQIRNINENDSGAYTSRITQLSFLSRTREEERDINVTVYAPPTINLERSSAILYTYRGNLKKTRLRCYFWGFPIPDIKLLKKGKQIKSVKGNRLIKGTVKTTQGKKLALGNYTCEAVNRFGVGRHTVVVREAAPPTPPRNLTTNAQCDCLTITWEPPADTGGFPISLYIQELSLNGTVVTSANVGSNPRSYTFTRHLKPNTEYKISLAGETVAKKGKSAEVIVKTSPCPPSGQMFILNEETTINSTNLTVRWTRPPDDGGDKEISYTLEYSRGDTQGFYVHWSARKGLTEQLFNVEGLARGSFYLFHVVATNSVGRSRQYAQKEFYVTPGAVVPTTEAMSKQGPVEEDLVYNMEVNCTSQLIQIILTLKHFPGLDFASFQLSDPSCKPDTVTDTLLILSTPLNGCDTTQVHQDQQVTYSNKVIARVGNRNSTFYMVEFPFSCRFGKEQLVGTPSFQARRKISTFKVGEGELTFLMKLFPTPEYKTPYSSSEYPVLVDARHTLYSQVELMASDPSLVIFIDTCTATPSMDSKDSIRYPFIEHGCAVDRTVKYLHKPNKAVQRFTILPFKFKGSSKPKVYLHCTVLVCHAGSNTSKCTKGCEPRTTKKRSLSDKQSSVHRVTLGPIVFARQITDRRKSVEHSPSSKISVLTIILVILGVAVFVVSVYGAYRVMTKSPRGMHVRIPTG